MTAHTAAPAPIANTLLALAAAALALVVPMAIDLFGPPLSLGVFAGIA